jgi:glycerophosphoryl diester phosphodiesterase
VVLGGLLALAVLTQTPPRERLPHFVEHTPANIAHAGAQGHAPGNTMEAFELALEMGADTLEMDLQITADGEIVVHHDGTVDRQTDGTGAIAEMSLEELRELDAGWYFEGPDGDFPFRGQGIGIPTLQEVFEAFPDTFMIIELKTDGGPDIIEPVVELVRRYDREDSVIIASFSLDYVHQVRDLLPGVATNMPEDETRTFYTLHLAGLHRWWRPPGDVFQVPEFHDDRRVVSHRFVRAADRMGVDVQVWTVNDPDDMRRILDFGAHAIMTDYPDVLVEIIAERG